MRGQIAYHFERLLMPIDLQHIAWVAQQKACSGSGRMIAMMMPRKWVNIVEVFSLCSQHSRAMKRSSWMKSRSPLLPRRAGLWVVLADAGPTNDEHLPNNRAF